MPPRHVLVAGATGAVGQVLVPLADRLHVPLTLPVRPGSVGKLAHPAVVGVELADARLAEVMRGCTTVIQLIGTMRARFAAGDTYETSDVGTTRRLVEVARVTGVDHLVLLSSVGAGRPVGGYLEAKARAEAAVRESGLNWTIVRPSAFADRGNLDIPRAVTAFTRAVGLGRFAPITLEQLAGAILRVAVDRAPLDAVLEGRSLWDVVDRGLPVR